MGCWNETCFISNAPILHRENIVVYFIAYKKETTHKNIYSNDLAEPIGLPIRASYNDYGSFEHFDKNSVSVKIIEKIFDNDLVSILNDVEGDKLGIKAINGEIFNVTFTMCNQILHDKLVKRYSNLKAPDNIKDDLDLEESIKNSKTLSLSEITKKLMGRNKEYYKNCGISNMNYFKDMYFDTPKNKRNDIIDEYKQNSLETWCIEYAMSTMRKVWAHTSGAGSQAVNYKEHIAFHNLAIKSILETIKRDSDDAIEIYNKILLWD